MRQRRRRAAPKMARENARRHLQRDASHSATSQQAQQRHTTTKQQQRVRRGTCAGRSTSQPTNARDRPPAARAKARPHAIAHAAHTCSVMPLAVQSRLASLTSSFIASTIFLSREPCVSLASNMLWWQKSRPRKLKLKLPHTQHAAAAAMNGGVTCSSRPCQHRPVARPPSQRAPRRG